MIRRTLPALLLIAVLIAACGGQGGGGGGTIELTAADSGSTVKAAVGDVVSIALDSNASTGFRWNLVKKPNPSVLQLVSSHYVGPDTGVPGQGGQEVWTFQATGLGTTSLRLAYFRPFEPANVEGTFSLTVDVS